MKPAILKILCIFVILTAVPAIASPPLAKVEVRASLSDAEVTIGQPFNLVIEVSGDSGVKILPRGDSFDDT